MMDWLVEQVRMMFVVTLMMLLGFSSLFLFGCASSPTAPAPTDSLCVAVGELHFSEQALNAMTAADIARFVKYNETWDAHCATVK